MNRLARWLARGARLSWHQPPPEDTSPTGWNKPPAPAASTPRVPGSTPGAGPAAGPQPSAAAPAPGHLRNGIYGRCVMTTYFFDTGITVTHDHTRMRRIVDVPPADEWDDPGGWLEDITDGQG